MARSPTPTHPRPGRLAPGVPGSKPDLISQLEQGKEPWGLDLLGAKEGEIPGDPSMDSGRGSLCKQVTARVSMSQAAEPQGEASGSFSGGETSTPVFREALGQEGRLGSLENLLLQERQLHRTHWTISKGEGAQKCSKWGPSIFLSPHLGTHARSTQRERAHTCETCDKGNTSGAWWRRPATHSGKRPHDWGESGRAFSHRSHLAQHRSAHASEKSHECGQCGRASTRLSPLHRHRRVRSGEKPFGCARCGKTCNYSTLLARHQRIHTRKRPFRCARCSKSFICKSSFRNHQKSHLCSRAAWTSAS